MKKIALLMTFLLISCLGNFTNAMATQCTICPCPSEKTMECPKKHPICSECLKGQVNATDHKEGAKGLKCWGEDGDCGHFFSLQDAEELFRDYTEGTEALKSLTRRLESASASCNSVEQKHASPEDREAREIADFADKVYDAFLIRCPGCKVPYVEQIQGCNAADCPECKTRFCNLCFKDYGQQGSAQAHHCAESHSKNYFEDRDAYTGLKPKDGNYTEYVEYERLETEGPNKGKVVKAIRPYKYIDLYHWQSARKKLDALFKEDYSPEVKEQALKRVESFLKENRMWPLPLDSRGKETSQWINEVMGSNLDEKAKKLLIRNEQVYQTSLANHTQMEDLRAEATHRESLLKASLLSLNYPALESLDFKDAHRIQNQGPETITPILAGHHDPEIQALTARLRDQHSAFFALGGEAGHIYKITDPENRVLPFVLSAPAPNKMDHSRATDYCESIGARLPTKEEFEALGRAMSQNGEYNRDSIPNMGDGSPSFWSSSVRPNPAYAFFFNGYSGYVDGLKRDYSSGSVRCVVR